MGSKRRLCIATREHGDEHLHLCAEEFAIEVKCCLTACDGPPSDCAGNDLKCFDCAATVLRR